METNVLAKLPKKKFDAKQGFAFALVNFLVKDFKLNGTVLDIGAGRGEYKKPFQKAGLKYRGIDAEPEEDFINKCSLGNESIPFSDNHFDVVFMRYVIEHIDKGEPTQKTLDEIKRVLKPNGVLIMITSDWIKKHKTFYDTFDHVSPYTQMSMRRLLEYNKFETIICRNYINIPYIWRWFPLFSFRYKVRPNGILYIGKSNRDE